MRRCNTMIPFSQNSNTNGLKPFWYALLRYKVNIWHITCCRAKHNYTALQLYV